MRPLELDSTHFKAKSPDPKYPDLPFSSDLNENCMISIWLPTDEEVADIIKGGVVSIRIAGNQPLPMSVSTGILGKTEQEAIDAIREDEWTEANGECAEDSGD